MAVRIIYNKKTRKSNLSQRLLLKNGIQYTISITKNAKHKFRTIKPFKIKKWIISNVYLHEFKIVDKEAIKKIIASDEREQKSYDRVFGMSIDEIYELNLTNKQYETFKRFIDAFEINTKQAFYMIRKGFGLKTFIEFSPIVYLKEENGE